MTEKRILVPDGRRQVDRIRQEMWKLVLGAAALCAICATVSVAISVTTLNNRHDIVHAQDLVQRIQQERERAILVGCRDQNRRHDATVGTLHRLLVLAANDQFGRQSSNPQRLRVLAQRARAVQDPGMRERLLAGLAAEARSLLPPRVQKLFDRGVGQQIALINSLQPERDCQKLVHSNVRAGRRDGG